VTKSQICGTALPCLLVLFPLSESWSAFFADFAFLFDAEMKISLYYNGEKNGQMHPLF